MNLLKLLSATQSIGTIREKPAAYVTESLPSFGWVRPVADNAGSPTKRGLQAVLRTLWPFGRKQPAASVPISAGPVNRSESVRPHSQVGARWGRRAAVQPEQRELAFEALKPIRNDLRDEDFEVTTVARSANGPAARKPAGGVRTKSAVAPEQALFSLEPSTR